MEWIILLVIALVVYGTISSVRPSPRQQQIAQYREYAMQQGLHIKLPTSLRFPKEVKKGECPFYCLRLNNPYNPDDVLFLHRDDLDRFERNEPAQKARLKAQLAGLPETHEAIYWGDGLVGINWDERGGLDDIDRLHSRLQAITADLKTKQ